MTAHFLEVVEPDSVVVDQFVDLSLGLPLVQPVVDAPDQRPVGSHEQIDIDEFAVALGSDLAAVLIDRAHVRPGFLHVFKRGSHLAWDFLALLVVGDRSGEHESDQEYAAGQNQRDVGEVDETFEVQTVTEQDFHRKHGEHEGDRGEQQLPLLHSSTP